MGTALFGRNRKTVLRRARNIDATPQVKRCIARQAREILFPLFFSLFFSLPSFAQSFTANTAGDFGNVTVMEVTGNYDAKTPDDALNQKPREIIAKEFFRTHKDEYDFLVFFSNFDYSMLEPNSNAFYIGVRNDVRGIGQPLFDNSNLFGSAGKLQGTIDMGNIAKTASDPLDPGFEQTLSTLSHEMLHRWAAYVKFKEADGRISEALSGEDKSHWSFLLDSAGSVLLGNRWRDNGDGTFTSIGIRKYWSPLDLYLMGMIDKTQVSPMRLIENPNIDPARLPEEGVTISGTARTVTIDQIIAAEGERIPGPAASQKSFKTAFILLASPGTFTGAELPGIESIRNGWVTRVSILNDGKGIMEVAATPKEDLPRNPGISLPPVTPRTFPPNIDEGVSWLMANQQQDGSWRDLLQTMERDTAESVLTLKSFAAAQASYAKGLLWLKGTLSANLDYLARKTEALTQSGEDVGALVTELLARQNHDGGWGSNRNYLSNPTDTALALKTLAAAGYSGQAVLSKGIDYLKAKENADGGWGSGDGSAIQSTVHVLSVFHRYRGAYPLDEKIAGGTAFLLQKQNPDGGFGNSPSTVYDTALAVLALRELDLPTDVTNRAINYLLPLQSNDGSWYGSAYQTAVAVQAVLKGTIDPDLSIKAADIHLIPSTVTRLPTNVVISADVWNQGRTAVPQAKVALYDGAITEQNKVGEQWVSFPGQSSVTVTFSATIADGNAHRYSLRVDPDGLVKESNESNNTALKVLSPQTTYDLEVLSSGITVSANPVNIFDDVRIASKVTNHGTADALNVQLKYSVNDGGGPIEIALASVDVPAGATVQNEITWRANRPGVNLPITVTGDPSNAFVELSETNNQGSTTLTVNTLTQANLTVSYQGITLTPSPASERGNVTLSAFVKNEGFAAASDVVVHFYKGVPGAGGVLLGARTISSLPAGSSSTVSVDWLNIQESGEKIIYVRVDPDNLIPEIREDDNSAFAALKILTLPDFVLSSSSILFSPSAPKEGDAVSIQVTVQNRGEQGGFAVPVRVYEGSTLLGEQAISSIAGNAQATVTFAYDTSGKSGPHAIMVAVDPDNTVVEQSEENNQASRTFGVQNANLWLTEPYISPNGDGVKESTQFFFRLPTPQTVRIVIVGERSNPVRTFSGAGFENSTGGTVTWDGMDDQGRVVADGQYQIQIQAAANTVLGTLPVVVDNNRSPLSKAVGTPYLLNSNLTCSFPDGISSKWFPDESGLIFSVDFPSPSTPEYPTGLYTMSPNGEDVLRIVPLEWTQGIDPTYSYYFKYDLSPDGERVAFVLVKYNRKLFRSELSQLWVMDRDGKNLALIDSYDILQQKTQISEIKWSADGGLIVYSLINNSFINDLWVIRPDGTEKTYIDGNGDFYFKNLKWLPDGQRMVYSLVTYDAQFLRTENLTLWDVSGGRQPLAALTGEVMTLDLAGQRIVLGEFDWDARLYRLKLLDDGRNLITLADAISVPLSNHPYAIAPDGRSIAFVTGTNAAKEIRVADFDGNSATVDYLQASLPGWTVEVHSLIWSPDSSRIAFTYTSYCPGEGFCSSFSDAAHLKILNVRTGEQKTLQTDPPADFFSGRPDLVKWLSDGRSILGIHLDSIGGYYIADSETGETTPVLSGIIIPSEEEAILSPHEHYLAYLQYVNGPSSACYGKGSFDLWTISSLLNLTADLRVKNEASAVALNGIAIDLNFDSYQLEYADTKQTDLWSPIAPPSEKPAVNEIMTAWVPPSPGTFYVRLTARDKAGNQTRVLRRVSWGLSSSITQLYKTREAFSPNGDGVNDGAELHYKTLQPIHLEFNVYDEGGQRVRTITKDHPIPTEGSVVWDGRDQGGTLLPDGKYRIKIFDNEFFVSLDNTSPDVKAQLGELLSSHLFSIKQDFETDALYVELSGHAVDANLKSWGVEYGEGENPQAWLEERKGESFLVGKDSDGRPLLEPVADTVIARYGQEKIEWLVGKKLRLTANDFAGNRTTKVTDFLPQEISFYKWDDLPFDIQVGSIDLKPRLHRIGVYETIREPVVGMTVQYYKDGAWYDGPTVSDPASGEVEIPWDSTSVGTGIVSVRVKAVDALGNVYYSRAAGDIFRILGITCDVPSLVSAVNRIEGLTLLKFQVQDAAGKWTDVKVYDAARGDIIPTGNFSIVLTEVKERPFAVQMVGVAPGGKTYIGFLQRPACTKLSLDVSYEKASDCGRISGKALLQAKLDLPAPGMVSLAYYLRKPEGRQLLRQFDLTKGGWGTVDLDTTGLPEGSYPVEAVLTQMSNGLSLETTASGNLVVDRVLPTARITDPGGAQKLCPTRVTDPKGDWYGVPIEGIAADNGQVKEYKLYYGLGENPAAWLPAMTRSGSGAPFIKGVTPIQGRLGIWDVTDLKGTTYSLKLEVVDRAGNVTCYIITVQIDTLVEIAKLTADKALFSPNGDGALDDVGVSYQIDEAATVAVKVFRMVQGPENSYSLDAAPVRTIVSEAQHLQGTGTAVWDGRNDLGGIVPDGKYGIAVLATDSCGNTALKWIGVEVDNTSPATVFIYPTPSDPLGNVVEVKGTGEDLHFRSYTLEAGSGDAPSNWTAVATSLNPVRQGVLGQWNTFGLSGRWMLRLTAADAVGNRNTATVTIDLGARKTLIKDFSVSPKLFSPNGDGKLDTTTLRYELTDAASVTIEVVDSGGQVRRPLSATAPGAGIYNSSWDGKDSGAVLVSDGAYTVRLTATLSSNPSVTQAETITVSVDATPPTLDLKQPLNNAYFKSDVTVNGTISDSNLSEYTLSYTGEAGGGLLDQANQNRENDTFGVLRDLAEGSYTLHASAKDQAENVTEKNILFTIDRTPPKATLETPKEGDIYGFEKNVVRFTGTLVEKNLETYRLRYGSGDNPTQWTELAAGAALPTQPQLFAWNVGSGQGIPDGLYTLSLYLKDKAGFEAETKVKVTVDNTPPQAVIALPQAGSYIKQTAEIKGSAIDQNLDAYAVEFSEGGCVAAFKWSPIKTAKSAVTDGVLATWSALPLDGEYCLRLSAADKVGQKAETKVPIRVDTNPPAAPVLSGQVENKTNAGLTWSANGEPDLAGYNLYRGTQKVNGGLLTTLTHSDLNPPEGEHLYTVKAVDLAGWESAASNEVKIKIDLTGPAVKIRSPQEGAKISGRIDIKGTAQSQDDFKQYRLFVGQGSSPSAWNLVRTSPVPIAFGALAEWETLGLAEGVYSIKLEGEDLVGNISTDRITLTVDNTPPAPPHLLSAVANGADVTLTWQANSEADLAGYLLYRNDQLVNVTGIVVGDLKPYLLSGTTYLNKTIPDGTFKYALLAMDHAGNLSDRSNLLEVSLDTHPPHITMVAPLDQSKFQETVFVKGETADLDLASVQFQYKRVQDTAWINLGTPITQAPYATSLDPAGLGLSYGGYQLRGVATDKAGKSDASPASITATYTDLTPPGAPASLSALAQEGASALTWTANTESDLDGYNIYRTAEGIKTKVNASPVKTTTYSDAALDDGEYTYQVTAVDRYGNESRPSNSAATKIYTLLLEQPYTPVGLALLQINGTGAAARSTIEVLRETASGPSSVGAVQADAEGKFSLGNISLVLGENGFSARATDSAGNVSRRSDVVLIVYNEPPSAPTGLAASVQNHDVHLTWNPNSETDLTGYNLYRDGQKVNSPLELSPGQTSNLASFSTPSNRATRGFDGSRNTFWRSRTFNPGAFSPTWWQANLSAPELINRFDIYWYTTFDASGNEVPFAGKNFEIQAWSGTNWVTLKKVVGNSVKENHFDFTPSYRTDSIRIYITSATELFGLEEVRIAEVGLSKDDLITSAAYDDLQLPDGKYRYAVTAVDQFGLESSPSLPTDAIVGDIIPPSAPQSLIAAASASDIVLSWSANTEADLAGYNIYRKGPDGWAKLNTAPVTQIPYADIGLSNGAYLYRVTAVDVIGNESAPSNEVSVNIAVAPPLSPVHLVVRAVQEGRALTASWESPAGSPKGYRLYRGSRSGGPYTRVNTSLISTVSYLDSGLADGVTYYYVVVSVDAVGNESLFSNEATGTPSDGVPPTSPEIFFPALPGNPAILYKDKTDVAGFAEPGATAALSKNGVSVGEATVRGSDFLETFPLNYSGDGNSLSSDGKVLAYTFNGGIWLKDLTTGETTEVIQKGSRPNWSPDGSRLTYEFFDERFNLRIGLYDLKSRLSTPLTEGIGAYESGPSWSADGAKIGFISSRGGADDIWIKELATGAFIQVTDGVYPNRLKFSPDGRKIAYFVFQNLYLIDLSTGISQEIDNTADGFSLSWSPDGREIAFASYRNGNSDVYAWSLDNQTAVQMTTTPEEEFDTNWSPDGKQILFARWDGNGYSVRSVPFPLQGGERILQQDLNGLDLLFWVRSGEIAFVNAGTLIRISPKGHFRFSDMRLDIGENLFSAAARDAAGNISPPSPEITVIFDTGRLPDLDLSEGDLFIYPLTPVAGERVSVGATVRNKGGVEVTNLKIDLYLWDARGNLDLLKSETIGSLLPGAETMITGVWDSGGKTGTNTVMVIVDPDEAVDEVFEENNFATRDFIVTAAEGISLATTLDSTRYNSNQEVHLSVQLANSGPAREVIGEIRVEEINGEVVTLLPSFQTSLAYGSSRKYDFVWNTGATYAGPYTVHTILKNLSEVIAENRVALEILPDLALDSTLVTDKAGYQAREEVGLRVNVKNKGTNFTLSQLKVQVRMTDPAGNLRMTSDLPVSSLLPGASASLRATWNTGLTVPGDYRAVADVYLGNQLLQSRSLLFKVNPSLTLTGAVAATPAAVFFDQAVSADYTVQNTGNIDGSGIALRLLVIDPETGTIVQTADETIDLAMGASRSGRLTIQTGTLRLKRYLISLQSINQGTPTNLGQASFAVKDGTAPVISIRSPLAEQRIVSTVRIEAIVTDALSGVDRVEVEIAGAPWRPVPIADLSQGRYVIAWTPVLADTGIRTIRLRATDHAGNESIASVSVKVAFPPVADAGPDQTVNEGMFVTLDGSGSHPSGGNPLTYRWEQIAGPAVSLNQSDPVHPTFISPGVAVGGATLTFGLIVEEDGLAGAQDVVNVTVKNVNHPPIAEAGTDQAVTEGTEVFLDGSASFDPDGEGIAYHWIQTAGPPVGLSDPTAARPSFTAPFVGSAGALLIFDLTVSDGIDQTTDSVQVAVEAANHPPTANAGGDQTKEEGALVSLIGTASSDSDGDTLTYRWTQLAGPPVNLLDDQSPTPSFTAPAVEAGGGTFLFQLVVNDGLADSAPDQVTVTVLNRNDPPACGQARPSAALLWPPNHKLVEITLSGVTDAENDPVTLTITGVTQDEPVNGTGDGDTAPDAVIQGGKVLLRAERSGNGNGRVYHISFTARDRDGGACTGFVTVGVPHNNKGNPIDDGQVYDSTRP